MGDRRLRGCGCPAARMLVRTSLRGIDTHGIVRVPDYVARLRSGEVNPVGHPCIQIKHGALHVEGNGTLGQVVGMLAVNAAVEASQTVAAVPCFIGSSGNLSALGLFALHAAEAGLIALICQATPPIMALVGARRPAIGNNPLAFLMPLRNRPPLVFDMAASTVARGRVAAVARERREIPDDWAIGAMDLWHGVGRYFRVPSHEAAAGPSEWEPI